MIKIVHNNDKRDSNNKKDIKKKNITYDHTELVISQTQFIRSWQCLLG